MFGKSFFTRKYCDEIKRIKQDAYASMTQASLSGAALDIAAEENRRACERVELSLDTLDMVKIGHAAQG